MAVVVGLACVNVIEPGQVESEVRDKMLAGESSIAGEKLDKAIQNASNGWKGILEIFQRMIPKNLFKAAVEGQLLGLIFFSLLFGFFISHLPEKLKNSQLTFWEGLNTVILKITNLIISFAPYGVFGLVTPTLMMVGIQTVYVMGTFALTVLLGLFIHSFIVLPILLKVLANLNFTSHFKAISPALLTAFSTASSSATLPVTLNSITQRAGVSKKIASFTLPLGATMNMDGTALFECISCWNICFRLVIVIIANKILDSIFRKKRFEFRVKLGSQCLIM